MTFDEIVSDVRTRALGEIEDADCFSVFEKYAEDALLAVHDVVTGNDCGSWSMNRIKAQENVVPALFDSRFHDWLEDMGLPLRLDDAETVEVLIRCAAFDSIYSELLEEMERELDKTASRAE